VAARDPLTVADLARLAVVAAAATDPRIPFAAAERLVRRTIGHRLFTVTRVHEPAREVERVYTTNPAAYPVGGRKQKRDTAWARVVLSEGRVFLAGTPAEVREAFPDHERLASLGIGAILNVPIAAAGRPLGVMNVSHEAGWFTPEDVDRGRVIAALLTPAFLAAVSSPPRRGRAPGGRGGPGRRARTASGARRRRARPRPP
jgi:GAF domain-containing protein